MHVDVRQITEHHAAVVGGGEIRVGGGELMGMVDVADALPSGAEFGVVELAPRVPVRGAEHGGDVVRVPRFDKQGKIVGDYVARTDEAQKDLSTHAVAMEKGLASVEGDLAELKSLPSNLQ